MNDDLLADSPELALRPRGWNWSGPLMLLGIAAGTVALWRLPGGQLVLWPFTLLATWYHEMGHALTALLLGGDVLGVQIFADGSGLAAYRGVGLGRIGQALVAAGGPVAPSLVGGAMLACSRSKKATRICLFAFGAVLALSALVWIDWWKSTVGAIAILTLGAAVLALAALGGDFLRKLAVQVCGVQACVALWRDWGYFFASEAHVGGEVRHSDASAIAELLWLPHWFWGFALAAFSIVVLLGSMAIAFRPQEEKLLDANDFHGDV